jgi:hypothetical protein
MNERRLALVGMIAMALGLTVNAKKPVVSALSGAWDIEGSIRYTFDVPGLEGQQRPALPAVQAVFETDPSAASIFTIEEPGDPAVVWVTGPFQQRQKKIWYNGRQMVAPQLEGYVRDALSRAPVPVEVKTIAPGQSMLNITMKKVKKEDRFTGHVRVQYIVTTAAGERGIVVVMMQFSGRPATRAGSD